MKYLLVETTERPAVIGTPEEIAALGNSPRPEPAVRTLDTTDAPNWQAAREGFGFKPRELRFGS